MVVSEKRQEICEKKQADPVHRPIIRLGYEHYCYSELSFFFCLVDGKEGVKTFQFLIPRFLPFCEKICLFLFTES